MRQSVLPTDKATSWWLPGAQQRQKGPQSKHVTAVASSFMKGREDVSFLQNKNKEKQRRQQKRKELRRQQEHSLHLLCWLERTSHRPISRTVWLKVPP
eukprot:237225-Pelagomonas_calceolata.AAC.3